MEIKKMQKIANEIINDGMRIGYRNVIGYFVGSDGDGMVFVSKETSKAPLKGIFFDDFASEKMYNIQTGEEVSAEDIFGKTFFDEDATLKIDTLTPEEASLEEKIDILFSECQERANVLLESRIAFVMANDFLEDEDEKMKRTYERLVILYNYLNRCTEKIRTEEFAYIHHELMTI